MNPSKKTIRINVYLTDDDKKYLNGIKYKYQLSYSTIANILVICLLGKTDEDISKEYIYTNDVNSKKTSIKPRTLGIICDRKTILFTNAIKLFARNELVSKGVIENNKKLKQLQENVLKSFKETKDPNWNGNEWQRRMPKLLKQNREYYKRILDNE